MDGNGTLATQWGLYNIFPYGGQLRQPTFFTYSQTSRKM